MLAVTADKLATHFAGMEPEQLETRTPAIKDAAIIGREAHGWNKPDQGGSALVQINFAPGTVPEAPAIDLTDL
jgi:hypothetical protein